MSSTNINKTKDENIDNMLKKSLISKILKSLFLKMQSQKKELKAEWPLSTPEP